MATKEQLFGILAGASGPMSRVELEDKVGEKYQTFQTQLDRWIKQGFVEDTGDHHYVLTDAGREEALKRGEFKDIDEQPGFAESKPPLMPTGTPTPTSKQAAIEEPKPAIEEPGLVGDEPTQESLATTEYQQFLKLGKMTGVVPLALIKQTADYIWDGGDFRDMTWVKQAMKDMDIRDDLAGRWWNSWRGKMHRPIPSDLPADLLPGKKAEDKSEAEKKAGTGKRDYIMSEGDTPTYVGEGLGDLDYKDALEITKIKAAANARVAGQVKSDSPGDSLAAKAVEKIIADMGQGSGTPADETTKVLTQIKALKELLGLGDKPDAADDLARFITLFKSVKEAMGDNKPVATSTPIKQFLYDNRTGEVKEVAAGQPMVIIRESTPVSQSTPIQVMDKDGKPMVLDLATFIKLEEHKEKQKQNEESHQTKMEIAKTFKDMLKKASTALSHMAEEES